MKKIILSALLLITFLPSLAFARENVDYWYIKDFQTEITVNTDSSLDIVENIVADAGIARKHGIFRVLPTVQYLKNKKINSPIVLKSITDFNGNKYHFETARSYIDNTITWKIGSEDIFVTGVNNYRISYKVKNAVRHNDSFDELYWNLSGNFWDIPIDSFTATVKFPEGINRRNMETNIYSGVFGDSNTLNPDLSFTDDSTVKVSYNNTLEPGQGITLSATFPDGIISPYKPTLWEKYGVYLLYLIPLIVLFVSYKLWSKYGRDPKINPTIAPEFEIPEKLTPIEMGLIYSDGTLHDEYISASIINLAVNGFIKIKKIDKKGIFGSEDFQLEKSKSNEPKNPAEKELFERLFRGSENVLLSSLKNNFYTHLPAIASAGKKPLYKLDYLTPYSSTFLYIFIGFGAISVIASIFAFMIIVHFGVAVLLSGLILLIFSPFMRKRSKAGHMIFNRIKGFKMYMDKAEKYRQQYLEKENIFEKLLPYAIMFGITREWIKKMKDIYGEKYFATYHPVWFYGAGISSFNADSFSSQISAISSNMASTMSSSPSSSGSGGGGFSGGGGGGGGGGGW